MHACARGQEPQAGGGSWAFQLAKMGTSRPGLEMLFRNSPLRWVSGFWFLSGVEEGREVVHFGLDEENSLSSSSAYA